MGEVDTSKLRSAAGAYGHYASEFREKVLPGMAQAQVPGVAFPMVAGSLQAAYQEAYIAADLFTRSAADTLTTLNLALVRVANYYETQDRKDANQFGPVNAPPVPQPRAYDGGAGGVDIAATIAGGALAVGGVELGIAMLFHSAKFLASSVAEVGAAAAVVAISLAAIGTLADPLPWDPAHAGWDDIESVLAMAGVEVPGYGAKIVDEAGWKGEGPEAFQAFVEGKFSDAFGSANSLSAGLKEICGSCGRNLWLGIGIFVSTTIAAGMSCLLLSFDPEPGTRAAAKWAVVISWALLIVNLALQMFGVWDVFGVAIDMIKTAYRNLHAAMMNDQRELDANTIALKATDTERIQDWTKWQPKTA
jgi:hypothetical protein